MASLNKNKIIFGGDVLIDLTPDTVSEESVLKGQTFHDKTGAIKTGTCTFDADTQDATASVAEILKGKTAYVRGVKIEGTMPNNGAVKLELIDKNKPVKIPQGYNDGSGTVSMNADDAAKLIPQNVRQGIEILGVTGNMTGSESVKLQAKSVTPKKTPQTVLPDEGFSGISQVNVAGIPYVESDNSAGGKTVTIG